MSRIIYELLQIKSHNTYHKHDMIRITISGNQQVKKFLDWIYVDSTIHLDRKYKLYQELLCNMKSNTRTRK